MDGWGLRATPKSNAVALANTPAVDELTARWPHARLAASGPDVGLPDGQVGNSEVGHMNIGAGRVVMQDLPR
ncbi:MAG: 2,3-bisphosphoglycerate-independent phosphoglycerate mutase, partial [Candidatus Puniceispirillaceae bacterium]